MNNTSEKEDKFNIILKQLKLIDGINRDIKICKQMNSPFMVKQYQHLKKEYTKNLLKLLADFQLPITYLEAA